jgi:hypothetical protein
MFTHMHTRFSSFPHPPSRPQVVVATELPLAESIRVDEWCHSNGVAFIKVGRWWWWYQGGWVLV